MPKSKCDIVKLLNFFCMRFNQRLIDIFDICAQLHVSLHALKFVNSLNCLLLLEYYIAFYYTSARFLQSIYCSFTRFHKIFLHDFFFFFFYFFKHHERYNLIWMQKSSTKSYIRIDGKLEYIGMLKNHFIISVPILVYFCKVEMKLIFF